MLGRRILQPKQGLLDWLVENAEASWLGFGGSRGGAKSGAIRRIQVRRRIEYPGTSGQVLRRVWDDVQKNHVNKMWEEFPELFQYYKSGEHVIEFPTVPVSRLFFDSAENAIDVERKAFGPEFMDIFVDQAEQFTEKELKQLKTTCRWPGMPVHKCKFGLFFNPGGASAGFLQRVFSTKEFHEREIPQDFGFVQAYGWDNVEWCRAALREDAGYTEESWSMLPTEEQDRVDLQLTLQFYAWDNKKRYDYFVTRSQYGQELNRLDASMRPGQLLGDFTRFAGQYFSNWNEAEHVIPLDDIIFQSHWPKWISIDWGFSHHTAVHWHTQAGVIAEDGTSKRLVITYREFVTSKLSEAALAEQIVAANNGEAIENIFGGHDLWSKDLVVQRTTGITKEQAMSRVFRANGLPTLKKAKTSRVDGWRLMHRMLDEGEWLITRNCKEAISAMPTAIHDKEPNDEDVLKIVDLQDDVRDSLRYGLYSMYGAEEVPFEERLKQMTAHLTDPTNRNIQLTKIISQRDKEVKNRGAVNNRSSGRARRWQ